MTCAMAGVEHLLRDVKDATVSTLAAEVSTLAAGLSGLKSRLLQIQEYLSLVIGGKLPVNHDILYQLQVCLPFPAAFSRAH
jgi:26S proteasome regulatory subunit N8